LILLAARYGWSPMHIKRNRKRNEPPDGTTALPQSFAVGSRPQASPEPMPPETNRLVADVDAPHVKQILGVSERQLEADVQHHHHSNDLPAGPETLEGVACRPPETLRAHYVPSQDKFFRHSPRVGQRGVLRPQAHANNQGRKVRRTLRQINASWSLKSSPSSRASLMKSPLRYWLRSPIWGLVFR
jgi:hypothetical protein